MTHEGSELIMNRGRDMEAVFRRMADEADVPVTNALVASAFSLEEEKVQRAFPPSVVKSGADIWMVEECRHWVRDEVQQLVRALRARRKSTCS